MNENFSGASKFLERLDQEFKKKKIKKDFDIYLPNQEYKKKLISSNKLINIARLDGVAHFKFTAENFKNFAKLRYNLNLFNPLNKNFEIKLFNKIANKYLNRFNQFIINNCDGIVFQSNLSYEFHKKFTNLKNKKFKIILNGAPNSFTASKNSFYKDNYPNIVISATFRPHKRLVDSIYVINYLKKKYSKIKLHVVGLIDDLTKIKLKNINTENVIFHGLKKQSFMNSLYHNCQLGLATSYLDPCPNSVVEMLSCGLPVLTTTASGAYELVNYREDFSIKEEYNIEYIEFQSFEKIPSINILDWSNKIEKIIENEIYFKDLTKSLFTKNLEINLIAEKYIEFVNEFKT